MPDKETFQSSELREAQTQENIHTHIHYIYIYTYTYIVCDLMFQSNQHTQTATTRPQRRRKIKSLRNRLINTTYTFHIQNTQILERF